MNCLLFLPINTQTVSSSLFVTTLNRKKKLILRVKTFLMSLFPRSHPWQHPLTRPRAKAPAKDDLEIVRTVVSPPDRPDQKLPAIRIRHPSPEMRDGVFEKEMVNGVRKPLTNGWNEDYFGQETNGVDEKE